MSITIIDRIIVMIQQFDPHPIWSIVKYGLFWVFFTIIMGGMCSLVIIVGAIK